MPLKTFRTSTEICRCLPFRRQTCIPDHQICNLATCVLPFYTRNDIANALVAVRKVPTSSETKKKAAHVLIRIVGVFSRWQQLEYFHLSTVNPHPFLTASISIEARAHNSLVVVAIPRFFSRATYDSYPGRSSAREQRRLPNLS
jgi:hypothetical protein